MGRSNNIVKIRVDTLDGWQKCWPFLCTFFCTWVFVIYHQRCDRDEHETIKNKAGYLIVEDRDKGGCITFTRDKEMSDEEADKMINDIRSELDELKKKTERLIKTRERECGIIYE